MKVFHKWKQWKGAEMKSQQNNSELVIRQAKQIYGISCYNISIIGITNHTHFKYMSQLISYWNFIIGTPNLFMGSLPSEN